MKTIICGIFIFAIIANRTNKYLGFSKWQVSLGLFVLAAILYVANILLIQFYITKRAPELANDEGWESTAGLGIVPKWVSVMGLLSISAITTALGPWIITLFFRIIALVS